MEFIIVTGLSGAGKSKAVAAMEDIGFYCVDNLPPALIPVFYDMCLKTEGWPKRTAVVTDTRGGELFKSFFSAISELEENGNKYRILFLDASDSVLVNRYQETRRKHPLSDSFKGSLEDAVRLEREILRPVKEKADYIIDTTNLHPQYMKERVFKLFKEEVGSGVNSLAVHCVSFGFKYGIPLESDLIFDVRCMPNPFYIDELRNLTGLDAPVRDYVMGCEETKGFIERLTDMIDYLVPLYKKEGKSQLVISVGCTGGHHRSVATAQYLCDHLKDIGFKADVTHRDIKK